MAIANGKLTKSLGNFENKQPNCTILFIFVFQSSFIDCVFSKIVDFDQLWTAFQQKLVKTCFLQNAQHFLSVYCPKLLLFFTVEAPLPRHRNFIKKDIFGLTALLGAAFDIGGH